MRAASALTAAGHDVATVASEGLGGAPDSTVAGAAAKEARILVTADRGFADLRAYPPGSHPGIVVLRVRSQARRAVEAALGLLVDYRQLNGIAGCTVILADRSIRIRRPESGSS